MSKLKSRHFHSPLSPLYLSPPDKALLPNWLPPASMAIFIAY